MPPGGYSTGLAEPEARSVQEICDSGRRVAFTWFDPPFRPEPPHANQAYAATSAASALTILTTRLDPGATTRPASGLGSSSFGGIRSTRSTSAAWSGRKIFSEP
jgi:hypothetical protein